MAPRDRLLRSRGTAPVAASSPSAGFRGGRAMPPIAIRPLRRSDREQLTALVNAHVGAVVPGVSVSVNVLLSQLEREPDETIVDPRGVARQPLVAVERDAVVGGAHVLRYGSDARVS